MEMLGDKVDIALFWNSVRVLLVNLVLLYSMKQTSHTCMSSTNCSTMVAR